MPTFYRYKKAGFTGSAGGPSTGTLILNGWDASNSCGNAKGFEQPSASATITNGGVAQTVLKGTPPYGSGFYLNADYFTGDVPKPLKEVHVDSKVSPHRSFKDFQRMRNEGLIVLTPRTNKYLESKRLPGALPLGPTVPFESDSDQQPITGPGFRPDLPCIPPSFGYYFNKIGRVPLDKEVLGSSGPLTTRVRRYYDRFDVAALTMPPNIGRLYGSLLFRHIEEREWDRGLITSTIAEANSGIYDLLTELAEARETISFIFSALGDIIRIIVRTKRNLVRLHQNKKANPKFGEDLASLWLGFRYAVQPIGYSINDSIDLVNAFFTKYQTTRQGTSFDTEPFTIDDWTFPSLKVIDRCFVKYAYSGDAALHNIKFNPLSTAWELVPLSFVIDWVLNVGDVLSAIVVPSNVQQQAMSYSRQVVKQEVPISNPYSPGHVTLTVAYYDYQPFNPLDEIRLNFDVRMTWKRWVDALALSWLSLKKNLRG